MTILLWNLSALQIIFIHNNEESNLQKALISPGGELEKFFTRSVKKFSLRALTYPLCWVLAKVQPAKGCVPWAQANMKASSMPDPIFQANRLHLLRSGKSVIISGKNRHKAEISSNPKPVWTRQECDFLAPRRNIDVSLAIICIRNYRHEKTEKKQSSSKAMQ